MDAVHALRTIPRMKADLVWHEDCRLEGYDAIVLPGGFSFGDYLRAGAIASKSPAMNQVRRLAEKGTPVLGICNGFQILIEAGLLPGALLRNASLRFVCRWVNVRVDNNTTPFTRSFANGQTLRLPIAHNEGRYYAPGPELRRLSDGGQIALRYCDEDGRPTESSNPTGTLYNIAGVCNKSGNVLGLMPHPERAAERLLSPFKSADGAALLGSIAGGG